MTDFLQNATISNGRLAGKTLAGGEYANPRLSYDGKEIIFAWVEPGQKQSYTSFFIVDGVRINYYNSPDNWKNGETWGSTVFTPQTVFHIYKANIDGSKLVQLTDGRFNDHGPCWLPNGRIVFVSERRVRYARCGGPDICAVLHSMKADGNDIINISLHETNQWSLVVNNSGGIVFTQWDYIDRGASVAHHIWESAIDGSNPRSYHGNYPTAGWEARPWAEYDARPIPNTVGKYVATSSGHHHGHNGAPIIIDVSIKDDNKLSQVKAITDLGACLGDNFGPYGPSWPISEDYYLTSYLGELVLLDKFGNREPIWKPATGYFVSWIIPAQARPLPAAVPATRTWQGERAYLPDHKPATLAVMNIYESDFAWPAGIGENKAIKSMRIVQYFPKEMGDIKYPKIGNFFVSDNSPVTPRMVLGTVPVKDDGSVYCYAPVGKLIYFQALDDKGRAVQNMLAGTYVHPGEQLSCIGCHEDKWSSPRAPSAKALQRAPSPLEPEAGFPEPTSFYRMVKPILDKGPMPMDYSTAWKQVNTWNDNCISKPGIHGARVSKLMTYADSLRAKNTITDQEVRRIAMWIDCQANEYGASMYQARQRMGELIWPMANQSENANVLTPLDIDPWNISGVEVGLIPPDNTPPSGITNVTAVSPAGYPFTINLSWNPATDNESGVGCYSIIRDGVQYNWTTMPSFTDFSVNQGESHTYEIIPVNRSGKEGAKATVTGTCYTDATPPAAVTDLRALAQGATTEFHENAADWRHHPVLGR